MAKNSSDYKGGDMVQHDIAEVDAESLIGRMACLAIKPDVKGQITMVAIKACGRTYFMSWFDESDGMLREVELDGFQLILLE